jgi:Cu2+-exporting ATPase
MGCDCCGSLAPATEPVAAPIAAPIEETSSCQDSCCGGGDSDDEPLETKDPGQGEPNQGKPEDCCSSGKCADDKAKDDTDAPDCCRGKVGRCCDTSCLDRLAMRECEISAVAAPGANAQAKSE